MSKAQGFPVSTIALIVIILLTIAALSFFFFQSYWKGQESTSGMQCQQKCKEIQSAISANDISTLEGLCNMKRARQFCEECSEKTCIVSFTLPNGTVRDCPLNCDASRCEDVCGGQPGFDPPCIHPPCYSPQ